MPFDKDSPFIGNAYRYDADSRAKIQEMFDIPDFEEDTAKQLYGQFYLEINGSGTRIFVSEKHLTDNFHMQKYAHDDFSYQIEPKNMGWFNAMYLS